MEPFSIRRISVRAPATLKESTQPTQNDDALINLAFLLIKEELRNFQPPICSSNRPLPNVDKYYSTKGFTKYRDGEHTFLVIRQVVLDFASKYSELDMILLVFFFIILLVPIIICEL
ncbi:hypothetical protein M8C21_021422 [Ambrosia artemisiifolia]|uniref:Uncharacterized protein n=1 Tax=Ambrosia artemisiifolia TaxID=4212 RepID=A0AAD5D457_AMBAR|nr:hypothetical protein M8C21_021422 [Ambrosia artemisiifolia]